MVDLDAYFARIGYLGPRAPTLAVLHAITAAHTAAIPFENLDVLVGRPIGVEIEAIFPKLVTARRGGYCFEQNALLLHVLEQTGFVVAPLSARIRLQRPRDYVPARTHLFVRVDLDGEVWITDCGAGSASLTSALRWDERGEEQATAHEPRRIVRENDRWYHQVLHGSAWQDVCEFTGEEMPLIDRVVANWFTSAHPQSSFRARLTVARSLPDGRRMSILNRDVTVRERDGRGETRTTRSAEELLHVLRDSFGLTFPGTAADLERVLRSFEAT
jgi:N-hydroxyarylamine O-acetyltransferase